MTRFLVTPHSHINQSKGYIPGKTFTMRGGVYKLSEELGPEIISDSLEHIHGHPCQEPYTQDDLAQLDFSFVEGRAFYGGPLLGHYGHFLIQTLARLSKYDPDKHEIIVFSYILNRFDSGILDPGKLPSFIHETLILLGIRTEQVYIASSSGLVFAQVDIYPAEWAIPHPPTKAHLKWLGSKTRSTLASFTSPMTQSARMVYLSRTCHFKGLTAGETQIELLLYANGFRTIHPERLSMSEKVLLLNGIDTLISLTGSGLLITCLLPDYPKRVIQIARNKMASSILLQRRLNQQANAHNHEVLAVLDETFNTNEAMSLLDLRLVLEGIEEALGHRLQFRDILDQQLADAEYRDLTSYYSLALSLSKGSLVPSYEQIEACIRLAATRMSPVFYVVAIRSLIILDDITKALRLCYRAQRVYLHNPELESLYVKLRSKVK